MHSYCTLFDHNYLSRGLALYNSLKKNSSEKFKLYILATDSIAYDYLLSLDLDSVIVQNLTDIKQEYPILAKLESIRNRAEFSWTLSSFSVQFFMTKFRTIDMTYLDSDIFFYEDPKLIFDDISPKSSVLITPHNYYYKYDQTEPSGRYCVQFVYFKNNKAGNQVLEWWRSECEKSCPSKATDGKFGDQKYLDDWLSRFEGIVTESCAQGIGVAPWNVCKFDIIENGDKFLISDRITKVKSKVIFYHFHGLREYWDKIDNKWWDLSSAYDISTSVKTHFYKNYIHLLNQFAINCPPQEKRLIIPNRINYKNVIKTILKDLLKSIRFITAFKVLVKKEKEANLKLFKDA